MFIVDAVKLIVNKQRLAWRRCRNTLQERVKRLVEAAAEQILSDFLPIRLELYAKRRAHLIRECKQQWLRLDASVRFIAAVVARQLDITDKRGAELALYLYEQGYPTARLLESLQRVERELEVAALTVASYDYLLSMPISSMTPERVERLRSECGSKTEELARLRASTPISLWRHDLELLDAHFRELLEYG